MQNQKVIQSKVESSVNNTSNLKPQTYPVREWNHCDLSMIWKVKLITAQTPHETNTAWPPESHMTLASRLAATFKVDSDHPPAKTASTPFRTQH